MVVYQSFVFVAVAISVLSTITLLVWLAVPPSVAAEWIFGDGQQAKQSQLVTLSGERFQRLLMGDGQLLDSPWLRVPILLTAFSLLYFVATSLASEQTRIRYLQGIDAAMRWRLALRLGHRHFFLPASRWDRMRSGSHRGPRPELAPLAAGEGAGDLGTGEPDLVAHVRQQHAPHAEEGAA